MVYVCERQPKQPIGGGKIVLRHCLVLLSPFTFQFQRHLTTYCSFRLLTTFVCSAAFPSSRGSQTFSNCSTQCMHYAFMLFAKVLYETHIARNHHFDCHLVCSARLCADCESLRGRRQGATAAVHRVALIRDTERMRWVNNRYLFVNVARPVSPRPAPSRPTPRVRPLCPAHPPAPSRPVRPPALPRTSALSAPCLRQSEEPAMSGRKRLPIFFCHTCS
jgi:hypothetical protein